METDKADAKQLPISDELKLSLARFVGINFATYGVEDHPSVSELRAYAAKAASKSTDETPTSR